MHHYINLHIRILHAAYHKEEEITSPKGLLVAPRPVLVMSSPPPHPPSLPFPPLSLLLGTPPVSSQGSPRRHLSAWRKSFMERLPAPAALTEPAGTSAGCLSGRHAEEGALARTGTEDASSLVQQPAPCLASHWCTAALNALLLPGAGAHAWDPAQATHQSNQGTEAQPADSGHWRIQGLAPRARSRQK